MADPLMRQPRPAAAPGPAGVTEVLARFDDAWQGGAAPDLGEHLPALGDPARGPALEGLVCIDLERRLKAGERAGVPGYLERYPELREDPEALLRVVTWEFHLRLRREPGLSWEGHVRRYRALVEDPGRPSLRTPLGPALPGAPSGFPAVPGFEVIGEVGRGGMGVVYKARQAALNRVVALKTILSGEGAGPEERARFLAEAEAVAAVRHPGVVQVYEYGMHGGQPYFALEYCPGGSLATRLAGAPLPPPEAARVVEQVARAVHAAHQGGILHRDLKPANVLLSEDGRVKVTDFGLARRLAGGGDLTRTGAVLGTPPYMPPEQARGSKDLGPAADVYALGAVLYECLTGRPPFQAATPVETILQVVSQEPAPPARVNAAVPPDLDTVCLRCLEKEAGNRYPTAGAVADELGRYLAGEPVLARPAGRLERLGKWARRNPAYAGLLAALTLAAAALAGTTAGTVLASRGVREQTAWAVHTGETQAQALRAYALILKAENAHRTYLLTGAPGDSDRYLSLRRQVAPELDRLREVVADHPDQQGRADRLASRSAARLGQLDSAARLKAKGDAGGALRLAASAEAEGAARDTESLVDEMLQVEARLDYARRDGLASAQRFVDIPALAGAGFAALLAGAILWLAAAARRRPRPREAGYPRGDPASS